MTVPAVPSFVQGLRNSRQSLGDGTLQGRVRSATPYRQRATSGGEAIVTAPTFDSGFGVQRLFVRAIADQTIASGGDHIVWETEGLPARRGFDGWNGGASDEIIMPASGVLVVSPSWAWSTSAGGDGYVTRGDVDYPFMTTLTNPGATGTVWQPEPRYIDVEQGDVVKVKVDQSSGSGQTMVEATCEMVLWVTARKAVPPEVAAELWLFAHGNVSDLGSETGPAWNTDLYTPVSTFGDPSWESAVTLSDGRVLYVWVDGNNIQQGHAPSQDDFIANGSVTFDQTLFTADRPRACVSKAAGKLWLSVAWYNQGGGTTWQYQLYESSDDGATWTLNTTLASGANSSLANTQWGTYDDKGGGAVFTTDGGRLVIMAAYRFDYFGDDIDSPAIYTSDDNGATWTRRWTAPAPEIRYQTAGRTIAQLDNGDLWACVTYDSGGVFARFVRSTDGGDTWAVSYTIEVTSGVTMEDLAYPSLFTVAAEPDRLYAIAKTEGTSDDGHLWYNDTPTSSAGWTREGTTWAWGRSEATAPLVTLVGG